MSNLPYDDSDPYSIEEYAQRLLNKSLREVIAGNQKLEELIKGKGSLGQAIEEFYFLYPPNSIAGPDFPNAGLELKTTPVISDKVRTLKSKERLVFNIINYEEEHSKEFIESSFWNKNSLLLLMFYFHEKQDSDIDLFFKLIRLFRFPAIDLKIIKDDWEKIREKIREGRAHEISEGDTFYLGACTKGATKSSTRRQPFSDVPAMQRAYSLKSKYINTIIQKTLLGDLELTDQTLGYRKVLDDNDIVDPLSRHSSVDANGKLSPIIKSVDDFKTGETIEEFIVRQFQPFYGHSESKLINELSLDKSKAKSKYYNLAKAILKVEGEVIEEFEKADIQLKTIRIEENGSIREHMSFPQIKYLDIIREEWETSELYNILTKKFFFVVFQKEKGEYYLSKVKFWNMPADDIERMAEIWSDTQQKIHKGDFKNFIKISSGLIGHIRPKAKNAEDLMETHLGTGEQKKSFWLHSSYIKKSIE